MIIKKIIERGFDIDDPIAFALEGENAVRNMLERKFVGRCYARCYIMSIDEILRQSECRVNTDGRNTFGQINVQFAVSAITYTMGEVINGCTIKSKDKGSFITCSTEHANIYLDTNKILEAIPIGAKISVRIIDSEYRINADKISINAIPFTFIVTPTAYNIGSVNTEIDQVEAARYLEMIETEEKKFNALPKAIREYYSELLYPKKTMSPRQDVKTVPIRDILKGFPTVCGLFYEPTIPFEKGLIGVCKMIDQYPEKKDSRYTFAVIIDKFVMDYCAHLRNICEYAKIYGNPSENMPVNTKTYFEILRAIKN